MSDKSGRNRAEELVTAEVEAAVTGHGLALGPGAAERILTTARYLQGAARRVREASR